MRIRIALLARVMAKLNPKALREGNVPTLSKWYAIQVETEREDTACEVILHTAQAKGLGGVFEELFSPKRATLTKQKGELVEGREPLLPGYVIAICHPQDLDAVIAALSHSPRFARLVGAGETFTPLSDQEVSWISAFTQRENRTVEMSEGFIEKGRVVITSGPLIGQEALVTKIDRRRRIAYLKFELCGRTVEAKLGLNLMRKERCKERASLKHSPNKRGCARPDN